MGDGDVKRRELPDLTLQRRIKMLTMSVAKCLRNTFGVTSTEGMVMLSAEMLDLTLQLSLERTVENKNVDNVDGEVFQRETPSV